MSENYTKVQQAFRVLHPLLAGYICQEMRREYQDNWWQEVLMTLSDQVRDLPDDNGDYATLMDSLDMANCLRLFDRKWNDLFKRKLSIDYRTWAKELMGVRNKLAHIGGADFSEDDTWRALDTMARLCEAFDDEAAEEIRKILRRLHQCGGGCRPDEAQGCPHRYYEQDLVRSAQLAGRDGTAPRCGAGTLQKCRVRRRSGAGSEG